MKRFFDVDVFRAWAFLRGWLRPPAENSVPAVPKRRRPFLMRQAMAWVSFFLLPLCLGRTIYVDSSSPGVGDGSIERPLSRLSLLDWTRIGADLAGGNPVDIRIRRGAVFYETLEVRASGTPSATLVLGTYGEGAPPILSGDDPLSGWTPNALGLSNTWSLAWKRDPAYLRLGPKRLLRTTSLANLAHAGWYWGNQTLYVRWDGERAQDVLAALRVANRSVCLDLTDRNFVRVEDLDIVGATGYAVNLRRTVQVQFLRCKFIASHGHISANACQDLKIQACRFHHSFVDSHLKVQGSVSRVGCYFSLFHDAVGSSITVAQADSLDLINCTIVGSGQRGVLNSSTGRVRILNSLITATGANANVLGGGAIENLAGTCVLGSSLVLPNGHDPTKHLEGVTQSSGNLLLDPQYTRTRREGVVALIEDDYPTRNDWMDLADLASTYGFGVSLSLNDTDKLKPEDKVAMQAKLDQGHDLVSHTRSHSRLDMPTALFIEYQGTADQCLLTISNQTLRTTIIGGPPSDALEFDLTNARNNRLDTLAPLIDASPVYACSLVTGYNHAVPPSLLTNVYRRSLKGGPVEVPFDRDAFYRNELLLSKTDLETTFHDRSGRPYSCRYLVYPGGYIDASSLQAVKAAGYLGGRVDSPINGSWLIEDFDLYRGLVGPGAMMGTSCILAFERNTLDYASSQNAFTAYDTEFQTDAYRSTAAIRLNGSTSFLSRPTNPSFDFSGGDWVVSLAVAPAALFGNQTIYYHAEDSDNYLKVFLDSRGAVNVLATRAGRPIARLSTPNGQVLAGLWSKLTVRQASDRWQIRVNGRLVTDQIIPVRLAAFGGDVVIGATLQPGSRFPTEVFSGAMDTFTVSLQTYARTTALVDTLCEAGAMYSLMSHGETGTPREGWRVVLDALSGYSGDLKVFSLSAAYDYLRTNAILNAQRRAVICEACPDAGDYSLRPTSPCHGAGDPSVLVGLLNLEDLNGTLITDAAGRLAFPGTPLSLGAFQPVLQCVETELASAWLQVSYSVQLHATGGVPAYRWSLSPASGPLPAGLALVSSGQLQGIPTQSGTFPIQLAVVDATGRTAQRAFVLNVGAMSLLPRFERVQKLSDGRMRFEVSANPGAELKVETSTDLWRWLKRGTISLPTGRGSWEESSEATGSRLFYRLSQ